MKNVLIIGGCGVGKTWVMRKLLEKDPGRGYKRGKIYFHESDKLIIAGKYDGTTFEGSDRLSMSVMTDVAGFLNYIAPKNKLAVFEGDRFTNSKFIALANPVILRIRGDGSEGRRLRGSRQTESHIKRIQTRVNNIKPDLEVNDSGDCLLKIIEMYEKD